MFLSTIHVANEFRIRRRHRMSATQPAPERPDDNAAPDKIALHGSIARVSLHVVSKAGISKKYFRQKLAGTVSACVVRMVK